MCEEHAPVKCPHKCGAELMRRELEGHIAVCPAKPLLCQWCQEKSDRHKVDVS